MLRKANKRDWLSAVTSGLLTLILLLATGLTVALVVVPKVLGGMSLTVLTGSMEPGIKPGDVVVTKGTTTQQAAELNIGDVITFLPYPDDPTLVTHRIIGKSVGASGTAYITQGDNNNTVDPWGPVRDFQVRGQVVYTVPKVGWAREWVGHYSAWIIPAAGVTLIVGGVIMLVTSRRRKPDVEPDAPPEPDDAPSPEVNAGPRRALLEV